MNYRSLFIELAFVVLFILTGLNLIGAGIETGAASTNADLSYDVGIEILGAGIVGFFLALSFFATNPGSSEEKLLQEIAELKKLISRRFPPEESLLDEEE